MKRGTSTVILGLGSNLGDREHHLSRALELLSRHIIFSQRSSAYEFAALLPQGAPASWDIAFLNMVAAGKTNLSPRELLALCKSIEAELGRPADHPHWSPRTLDIDILDYEGEMLQEPTLTLPHPGIPVRDFVLRPLAEILPEWQHPVLGLTPTQLLNRPATQLVGILNITPDSFSDGGKYSTPEAAFAQAKKLLAEGSTMLDIGAESTRPGATPLTPAQEWQRLEPVLDHLRNHLPHAQFSLDTRHAETVRRGLPYKLAWVNDVSGFTDLAMVEAVKNSSAKLVVMHNLGVPADKNVTLPKESDVVAEVILWLHGKIAELEKQGIARERIIADPGLGFGKTAEQSLGLVKRIGELKKLGVKLLVGHSEKSFLTLLSQKPLGNRQVETQKVSAYLAREGVDYLRVHDAAGNLRAIALQEIIAL